MVCKFCQGRGKVVSYGSDRLRKCKFCKGRGYGFGRIKAEVGHERLKKPKMEEFMMRVTWQGQAPWEVLYLNVKARYADEAEQKALAFAKKKIAKGKRQVRAQRIVTR